MGKVISIYRKERGGSEPVEAQGAESSDGKELTLTLGQVRRIGLTGAVVMADLRRIFSEQDGGLFDFTEHTDMLWVRLPLDWWSTSLGLSKHTLKNKLVELEAQGYIATNSFGAFDKSFWYTLKK